MRILLILTLLACTEGTDPPVTFQPLQLNWSSCPPRSSAEGRAGECADVQVPLRWTDPNGEMISIELRRMPTPNATRIGQLWLLDGGPGDPGWSFDERDGLTPFHEAGWDLIVVSHRGVGNSTLLECPDEITDEESLVACRTAMLEQWGEGLGSFSSYEAGRDVQHLIEAVRVDGEKVALYGLSYGVYWAMRVLQADPDVVDAVVFDSVISLGSDPERQGVYVEQVYDRLFETCAADRHCAGELGMQPKRKVAEAFAVLENGTCELDGWDGDRLRFAFSLSMSAAQRTPLGLAVVRRINRCSELDIQQLTYFGDILERVRESMDAPEGQGGESVALALTVIFEDAFPEEFDIEAIAAEHQDLLLGRLSGNFAIAPYWPRIGNEPRNNALSFENTPMITLTGGIDLQTPNIWEEGFAQDIGLDDAHRFYFPTAGHVVLENPEQAACASSIIGGFIADPTATIEASCIDEIPPLDFSTISENNQRLASFAFGTDRIWGSTP